LLEESSLIALILGESHLDLAKRPELAEKLKIAWFGPSGEHVADSLDFSGQCF
jgi:hypothetical protein